MKIGLFCGSDGAQETSGMVAPVGSGGCLNPIGRGWCNDMQVVPPLFSK